MPRSKSTSRTWIMVAAAVVLLLTWAPSPVRADLADLAGVTGLSLGMANARTASSDDWESAYHNPAALALREPGFAFGFGYQVLFSGLKAGGEKQNFLARDGLTAGIAGLIPFKGVLERRIGVGVMMYVPRESLMLLRLHKRDSVHFPLYDNRFQRLIFRPALAVRVYDRYSLGVAINYFVDLTGRVETRNNSTHSLDARANLELLSNITADFSFLGEPLPGLRTALVYRMQHQTNADFLTINRIGDIKLDLDIAGVTLYDPHQLTAGVSYDFASIGLLAEFDVTWRMWSRYHGGYTILEASVPSGTPENKHFDPVYLDIDANDTVEVRFGLNKRFDLAPRWRLSVLAGFGYEPPALAEQIGEANLMDCHHIKVGTGFVAEFLANDRRPLVGLEVGTQFHILPNRTHVKQESAVQDEDYETDGIQTANPGWPRITAGGYVSAVGFTLRVEL